MFIFPPAILDFKIASQASSPWDSDAQAFFNAAGIVNSYQQTALNNFVTSLKSNNIWNQFVKGQTAIYPFVGDTSNAFAYNLIDPRDVSVAFKLQFNGSLGYTVDGLVGDGATGYANTQYQPSVFGTLGNTHLSFMNLNTSTNTNFFPVVTFGGTGTTTVGWNANNMQSRLYNSTAGQGLLLYATTNPVGFWMGNRNSSTYHSLLYDGAVVSSSTGTTNIGTLATGPLYLLRSTATYLPWTLSFVSIGLGMSDNDASTYAKLVIQYRKDLDAAYPYQPETLTLVSRYNNQPTIALKRLIDTTISSLKTAGIWNKLDVLYLFNMHDGQAALQNWISNNYNATAVNAPTFTVKTGYLGASSGAKHLRTGFIPNNVSTYDFLNNSAVHFNIYQYPTTTATAPFGTISGTASNNYLTLYINGVDRLYWNANNYMAINDVSTVGAYYSIDVSKGFHYAYQNDVSIMQSAAYSHTFDSSVEMVLCGLNSNGSYSGSNTGLRNWSIGQFLMWYEDASLYRILKYFDDNVGGTF